jgi:two-component system, response regulator, stage 0 sporulation protein F
MAPGPLILIVEDDDDLRDVLRMTLELEGFGVDVASNGVDALVRLTFGPLPDAVVLNLGLPVMSGVELLDEIRRAPGLAGLPVVLVTGARLPADFRPAVAGIVAKPFDSEVLVGLLRRLATNPVHRAPPSTPA